MDPDHLRAFARRDWAAIARAKREHQARLFREHGPAAMVRIARELFAHARAVNPDLPSQRERDADLAHHVELKRALASVRRR
ncbi:MAG: hypothetical protein ACJ78W_17850 [Myxococcales bacterium]